MGDVRNAFGKLVRSLYNFTVAGLTATARTVGAGVSVVYDGGRAVYEMYQGKFDNIYKHAANIIGVLYAPLLAGVAYLGSVAYSVYKG
jgi:hypothetical protein